MARLGALTDTLKVWFAHRRFPVAVAVLAMALASPSLWFGLRVDDHLQRLRMKATSYALDNHGSAWSMFDFADGDPERTRKLKDLGFMPWWTLDTIRLRFLRPVAVFTHWIEYRLWPDIVPLMHMQSLLWFGALVALVAAIYRRFMGPGWVAGLAAFCYAVDDAHAWPVAWLANRNGLLAAFFGLLAVWLHDRWRTGKRHGMGAAAVVCLLLGLLSNEGALAACAYLFSYAVFLDEGRRRDRVLSLVPYAVTVVAWRIAYNVLGYGAIGSDTYIDPLHSPLTYLSAAFVRAPILLLGQWATPPSDFYILLPWPAVCAVWWCLGAAFLAWLGIVLIPLLRSDRTARFWCVGMLLALMPICATFPMDRLLLFVGVGAMGLAAQLIAAIATGTLRFPRWVTKPMLVLLIATHVIIAPLVFPLRIHGSSLFLRELDRSIESIPLDDDVTDKTVVVASAPHVFFTSYIPIYRALNGLPVPKRIRSFGGTSSLPVPVRLERVDDYTLLVEPKGGYRFVLVRDKAHPMPVGTRVELSGVTVEVMTLTSGGWPLQVKYQFDVPLEDPSLVWL
ncbi:MAG: hypothetical protein GWP08_02250, partial [Nitrospiraceae bacterium]|nr:hypothetical protein [Nitrospiraceae bacterium]